MLIFLGAYPYALLVLSLTRKEKNMINMLCGRKIFNNFWNKLVSKES